MPGSDSGIQLRGSAARPAGQPAESDPARSPEPRRVVSLWADSQASCSFLLVLSCSLSWTELLLKRLLDRHAHPQTFLLLTLGMGGRLCSHSSSASPGRGSTSGLSFTCWMVRAVGESR
eukprot:763867-Hanusia_phi.AAC.7